MIYLIEYDIFGSGYIARPVVTRINFDFCLNKSTKVEVIYVGY